jgi:beta-glucanase (GH16 family)
MAINKSIRPGGFTGSASFVTLARFAFMAVGPISVLAGPTARHGFKRQIFFDDFSGGLTDKWVYDVGTSYPGGPPNWGTGEIQCYTNSPANIDIINSNLVITPHLEDNGNWTSGRIETKPEHDWTCPPHGKLRVEARIRLGSAPAHSQQGIWPAFWALGSDYRGDFQNWPAVGEMDFLESANGEPTAHHVVHCGTTPGGPCEEMKGLGDSGPFPRGDWQLVSAEFSRAARDWKAECITFAVDGKIRFEITGARVGDEQAWKRLVHEPKFLLLNVAVGGAFPDALAGTKTPNSATKGGSGASMEVDYVAVYTT